MKYPVNIVKINWWQLACINKDCLTDPFGFIPIIMTNLHRLVDHKSETIFLYIFLTFPAYVLLNSKKRLQFDI